MDVRTTILDEATRLFAAHGFDGTSIQSIADAVGVRKPSLLYHFPSKVDLRESVLERLLSHWNERLPELLLAAATPTAPGAQTPRDGRFDRVLDALTSFFLEDPNRARLLVREALDRPDELRTLLVKYVKPWIGVVADQLATARAQGFVHEDTDVEAYALHVTHMVVGGVAVFDTLGAVLPGRASERSERLRAELVRLAKAGLFRRGQTERPPPPSKDAAARTRHTTAEPSSK